MLFGSLPSFSFPEVGHPQNSGDEFNLDHLGIGNPAEAVESSRSSTRSSPAPMQSLSPHMDVSEIPLFQGTEERRDSKVSVRNGPIVMKRPTMPKAVPKMKQGTFVKHWEFR